MGALDKINSLSEGDVFGVVFYKDNFFIKVDVKAMNKSEIQAVKDGKYYDLDWMEQKIVNKVVAKIKVDAPKPSFMERVESNNPKLRSTRIASLKGPTREVYEEMISHPSHTIQNIASVLGMRYMQVSYRRGLIHAAGLREPAFGEFRAHEFMPRRRK